MVALVAAIASGKTGLEFEFILENFDMHFLDDVFFLEYLDTPLIVFGRIMIRPQEMEKRLGYYA
jgi:hypothetical protein